MELRDGGENRGSSRGLQTKGIKRVQNGLEGRQAKISEKKEDGGERRQAREEQENGGPKHNIHRQYLLNCLKKRIQ